MRLFPSCTFKLRQLHKESTPCSPNSLRHRRSFGIQSAMPSQLSMRKRAESLIWTIIGGGAATRMIFVMTNTCLLQQNTSLAATKVCLPRQSFCCDKQVCHDRTHLMSWQNFCCNKNYSCGSSRQYLTAYQPTTPSPQKERQTNTCTHTITL